MEMSWWNYATGEYDLREAPTTDEEALHYVPQVAAAHGLFRVYRAMGVSIFEALKETLTACIGE